MVKSLERLEPGATARTATSTTTGWLDAENRFVEYAMEHGRIDRDQARAALAVFRKARVIKFDAVSGTFDVKHGAFFEPDVSARDAARAAPDAFGFGGDA